MILGADAALAAAPASPVQLAHACMQAGYDAVVPASWGDELIAAAVLHELRDRPHGPAIQCSCPLVARRLLSLGTELRPYLVSLVSPPVATARYLRTVHAPARLRITYAGRCPGAVDDDIDARITPEELLAVFADRHISLCDQPTAFDSVIPPDRRRFHSMAAGVPRREALRAVGARELVEVEGADLSIELAQLLLSGSNVLADVAPALGCVCCGGGDGRSADEARARVAAVEPPRATGPVVDDRVPIDLSLPVSAAARTAPEIATSLPVTPAADLWTGADGAATPSTPRRYEGEELLSAAVSMPADALTPGRRRSPGQGFRALVSTAPIARSAEGRHLPRAYVARRRSSPRGLRAITGEPPIAARDVAQRAPRMAHAPAPDESPARAALADRFAPEAATPPSTMTGVAFEPTPLCVQAPARLAVADVREEHTSGTARPEPATGPEEVTEATETVPATAPGSALPAEALADPPELAALEAVELDAPTDAAAASIESTDSVEAPVAAGETETAEAEAPTAEVPVAEVPAAETPAEEAPAAEPAPAGAPAVAEPEPPADHAAQPWSERRERRAVGGAGERAAEVPRERPRAARGGAALRYVAIGAGLALLVVISAALGALLSQFLR